VNEPEYTGTATDFYVASSQVADIVNLAITFDRPILVEGEPGCGKTMLAYSIAAEKHLAAPIKIAVTSTARAQDLLYRVDSLRRLQDAQNPHATDARFIYPYITLGRLGQAIHAGQRCVVLIDEIDKADIDFPNDLLEILDTFSFQIDALPSEEVQACIERNGFGQTIMSPTGVKPIVVITSNREKRLPEPFLRRCLYVRLRFPEDPAELVDIVRKNTKLSVEELNQKVLNAAVKAFLRVRAIAITGDIQKLPTTSELIDWVKILHWKGTDIKSLEHDADLPPYWELLFKQANDLDTYPRLTRTTQRE
jgi:MoxR-like ATPases